MPINKSLSKTKGKNVKYLPVALLAKAEKATELRKVA
jgi:hypothetical protein